MKPLVLLFTVLCAGCAPSPVENNKEIARRVFSEVLGKGNFALASELYSPQFVNHGLERNAGFDEDQAAARGWRAAFPDLAITVSKVIAENDEVVVYWVAQGTNTGSGNGLPATGKRLYIDGITIWRIVEGKITDEWSAFDQYAILSQLGLVKNSQ